MKNEFGAMKTVRDLILRGYGYTQMLEKANLTEDDLSKLCTSYSDFNNEIIKRYKRDLALQKETVNETVSEAVKEEKAQEVSEPPVVDIRQTAKNMGIKNWHNKSEERLLKEIAEQLG